MGGDYGHANYVAEVTFVHNALRNGMKNIAGNLEKRAYEKDIVGYLGYCEAFHHFLEGHHTNEDMFVFPEFKKCKPEVIQKLEEDHHSCEANLKSFKHHIDNCHVLIKAHPIDEAAIRASFTEFGLISQRLYDLLDPHFRVEESGFSAEELKSAGVGSRELKAIHNNIVKRERKGDPSIAFAFLFHELPFNEAQAFVNEALPWFPRKFLFSGWMRKHSNYWVFSSYPPQGSSSRN